MRRRNQHRHHSQIELADLDGIGLINEKYKIIVDKSSEGKRRNSAEEDELDSNILISSPSSSQQQEYLERMDKDAEIRAKTLDLTGLEHLVGVGGTLQGRNMFKMLYRVVEFLQEQEKDGILGLHLSWQKKNGLYLNMRPISVEFLVNYLVEEVLYLFRGHGERFLLSDPQSRGFVQEEEEEEKEVVKQAPVNEVDDDIDACSVARRHFRRILEFLGSLKIRVLLKEKLLGKIAKLKCYRRTGQQIGEEVKNFFESVLLDLLAFGLHIEVIDRRDLCFLLSESRCFLVVKDLFSRNKYLRLEQQIRSQLQHHQQLPYLPWILVVKKFLNQFEKRNQLFLSENRELSRRCMHAILTWLNLSSKSGLINWLFQFLFREYYEETKRQFLFIQGPTDTGKSSFLETLLYDVNFQTESLTTQYFSTHKQGNFDLHCLIFDDPTPLSNKVKSNLLDAEFFLNLARSSTTPNKKFQHIINVKNGYMLINRGQICILSNDCEEKIFSSKATQAIKTRLLKIVFDDTNPFPLQFNSPRNNPFVFETLDDNDINSLLVLQEDEVEDLDQAKGDEQLPPPQLTQNAVADDDHDGNLLAADGHNAEMLIMQKNIRKQKPQEEGGVDKEEKRDKLIYFPDSNQPQEQEEEEEKKRQEKRLELINGNNRVEEMPNLLSSYQLLQQGLHSPSAQIFNMKAFSEKDDERNKEAKLRSKRNIPYSELDEEGEEKSCNMITKKKKKKICTEEKKFSPTENIISHPLLNQETCSYYTWLGILKMLEVQILKQSLETLRIYIPHEEFREQLISKLKEKKVNSNNYIGLYDIIQTLSEEELECYVTQY